MALSINWQTKLITVPLADLTFVSGNRYTYNINTFRLGLRALESSAEGMSFPETHTHNTEYLISGITYARVVQIINGYKVEFEFGNYTVSLLAANHNILDVLISNGVSVVANNSAGLINNESLDSVEIASAVWDASASTYNAVGTTGEKLNDAGSAGDPWGTSLPGGYSAGTAGKILGQIVPDDLNNIETSLASSGGGIGNTNILAEEVRRLSLKIERLLKAFRG